MTVPETQKDILSYLDHVTREFDPERIERFTTVDIARAMSISRNLASQYLNDLVRRGLLVKAGIRPVCYFHRHDIERYLQARLDRSAFDTVDELLGMRGAMPGKGFDRAIGHSLSLSSAIEQMRVAMGYPPCGLPVLIMGASGTGKTFMVKLMLEYGKGAGLIAQDGKIVTVDCSRCAVGSWDIEREYFGEEGHSGWSDRARGGILLLKYIDLLPRPQREFLFTHALLAARANQDSEDPGASLCLHHDGSCRFRPGARIFASPTGDRSASRAVRAHARGTTRDRAPFSQRRGTAYGRGRPDHARCLQLPDECGLR